MKTNIHYGINECAWGGDGGAAQCPAGQGDWWVHSSEMVVS